MRFSDDLTIFLVDRSDQIYLFYSTVNVFLYIKYVKKKEGVFTMADEYVFDYTPYMDKIKGLSYSPLRDILDNQVHGLVRTDMQMFECKDPAGYTHLYNKACEFDDLCNMMEDRDSKYTEGLDISNPYNTFARMIYCCNTMLNGNVAPKDRKWLTSIRDTLATELNTLQQQNTSRNYIKEEKDYLHDLRNILARYSDFGQLRESDDFAKSTLNLIRASDNEIAIYKKENVQTLPDEFNFSAQEDAFRLMQDARLAGFTLIKKAYIRKALHQLLDTMKDNPNQIEYSITGSTKNKKLNPIQEGVRGSSDPTYQFDDDILLHSHPNETPLSIEEVFIGDERYIKGDFGHVMAIKHPIIAITPSGELYYSTNELINFGSDHYRNGGSRFGQVYLGNIRDFEF